MAITQVTAPLSVPATNADWTNMTYHLKANRLGLNNSPFILTNDDNTSIPAIAIGSYIQFGDSLYIVDTEDYAIQGTPVDGNNYIRIEPSGTTLIATWIQDKSSYSWNPVNNYYEISASDYALLPYLVLKDGTEYEKYSMVNRDYVTDQNLRKIDSPTFASVNTGHGANELYPMNQGVRTTDSPTFASVNTGFGNNEVYKFTSSRDATSGTVDSNYTLPSMAVGEYLFFGYRHQNTGGNNRTIRVYLPSGGTYQTSLGIYEYTAGGTQIGEYSISAGATRDLAFNIRRVS